MAWPEPLLFSSCSQGSALFIIPWTCLAKKSLSLSLLHHSLFQISFEALSLSFFLFLSLSLFIRIGHHHYSVSKALPLMFPTGCTLQLEKLIGKEDQSEKILVGLNIFFWGTKPRVTSVLVEPLSLSVTGSLPLSPWPPGCPCPFSFCLVLRQLSYRNHGCDVWVSGYWSWQPGNV